MNVSAMNGEDGCCRSMVWFGCYGYLLVTIIWRARLHTLHTPHINCKFTVSVISQDSTNPPLTHFFRSPLFVSYYNLFLLPLALLNIFRFIFVTLFFFSSFFALSFCCCWPAICLPNIFYLNVSLSPFSSIAFAHFFSITFSNSRHSVIRHPFGIVLPLLLHFPSNFPSNSSCWQFFFMFITNLNQFTVFHALTLLTFFTFSTFSTHSLHSVHSIIS